MSGAFGDEESALAVLEQAAASADAALRAEAMYREAIEAGDPGWAVQSAEHGPRRPRRA
jgi:hypothetical protein